MYKSPVFSKFKETHLSRFICILSVEVGKCGNPTNITKKHICSMQFHPSIDTGWVWVLISRSLEQNTSNNTSKCKQPKRACLVWTSKVTEEIKKIINAHDNDSKGDWRIPTREEKSGSRVGREGCVGWQNKASKLGRHYHRERRALSRERQQFNLHIQQLITSHQEIIYSLLLAESSRKNKKKQPNYALWRTFGRSAFTKMENPQTQNRRGKPSNSNPKYK